jgi:hypothetical protein
VFPFTENCYKKANDTMTRFYALQTIVIIVSALIPIVNVVDTGAGSLPEVLK